MTQEAQQVVTPLAALKLALEAFKRLKEDFDADQHEWEIADVAITAIKEALRKQAMREVQRLGQEIEQEPVVLRFNEWTVGKNDLSDHIYIGELTLAGIEDNLEGPEFGEAEIERFDAVIEALQEKLVTGRECKKVPLIAYIGVNNATPPQQEPVKYSDYEPDGVHHNKLPQRTWLGLTDEEYTHITDTVFHTGQGLVAYYKAIEDKLREKNSQHKEKNT